MTKHEPIELPRNIINEFKTQLESSNHRGVGALMPVRIISDIYDTKEAPDDVKDWCNNLENQWKLIDALRYGYMPEVERYVVPIFRYEDGKNEYEYLVIGFDGKPNTYLASAGETIKSIRKNCKVELTLAEIKAINPRYDVFAVAVANWEGDGV